MWNDSGKGRNPTMKKNTEKIIIVILVAIILVIVGVGGFLLLRNKGNQDIPQTVAISNIGMEAGIVTNDEEAAKVEEKDPFAFTTLYKRDIYITNGHDAICYIGNSDANYYEDMYIQIYLNDENDQPSEEIYLSQIIPRGTHIECFTASQDLEPGNYRGTLIHSNVDEDGILVGDMAVIVDIHVSE